MIIAAESFKNVDTIFLIHQLETTNEVESSVLSLVFSELFGVQIANIVEAKLLHVDTLEGLFNLHHSFWGFVWNDDNHTFKDSIILIERAI
jgi:hypothetical protein